MTDSTHVPLDLLHAWADGTAEPADAARVARHAASCAACRAEADRVRALLERASRLPHDGPPPADVWAGVAARIGHGAPSRASSVAPASARPRWARLAVAAAALVVATAAVTASLVRRSDRHPAAPAGSVVAARREAPASPPRDDARVMLAGYERAASDLRVALDARRDSLRPETAATVARALDTMDRAIAEAASALARDPGNRAILDMLESTHRHRLDLMRQASAIPAGA